MKIALRKSDERGQADHGWLKTRYSFSFSDYFDPRFMGYRDLRVINDDHIEGGAGFPTHGHRDMEILTYMLEGSLAHKDSMGSEGALKRGDVQTMSAGSGVRHSEFNASASETAHLLQIWIMPAREGIAPAYAQAHIPDAEKRDRLRLIAAPAGADNSALPINQDARIYASLLGAGKSVEHKVGQGRGVWIQMASGEIEVNGTVMKSGDGAAIEEADTLTLTAKADSEFLLFDLA
jgi:redox-sensitive bicupin YhaK (pirin superfamily)